MGELGLIIVVYELEINVICFIVFIPLTGPRNDENLSFNLAFADTFLISGISLVGIKIGPQILFYCREVTL